MRRRTDPDLFEAEQRIAQRKINFEIAMRAAGRGVLRSVTSPAGLLSAGVLGFLIAGGAKRRQSGSSDTAKAAKATGIAGVLMTGLMWFVREQFGSPVQIAQTLLAKVKARRSSVPQSPRSDSRSAQIH